LIAIVITALQIKKASIVLPIRDIMNTQSLSPCVIIPLSNTVSQSRIAIYYHYRRHNETVRDKSGARKY